MPIPILNSVTDLRLHVRRVKQTGKNIALVPTMGALHEGHMSLVRQGLERKAHVITSIFINPLQFAPNEDLSKYPRSFEQDYARLVEAGADAVYLPAPHDLYPPGFDLNIMPSSTAHVGLEDKIRPSHFQGVCTVVAKLFMQSAADLALFGEKDFQQLIIVTRMARDLDISIEIIPCITTRETDGLALSSRNVYLSPAERKKAPVLYDILKETSQLIRNGQFSSDLLKTGIYRATQSGFEVDYFEARNADTLDPVLDIRHEPIRLLIAAKIGHTRLIDNIGV